MNLIWSFRADGQMCARVLNRVICGNPGWFLLPRDGRRPRPLWIHGFLLPSLLLHLGPRQPTQLIGSQDPDFSGPPSKEGPPCITQSHVLWSNWAVRARGRRPSLRPICDNPPQYVLHQFSLCAALSKDNHLAHRDAQSTPCSVYCSPTFIKQINCFAQCRII